ncbi:unnamed protein product [Cylicocyclus nassatus]|uniref:Uncharacterized protein n=1 Tax=Cylicocyclus nassatus TaxID=53992 RepID=A0AA36DSZ5_CYLNA|nr:unnamed protein product [Cylicocyclus nassatus]
MLTTFPNSRTSAALERKQPSDVLPIFAYSKQSSRGPSYSDCQRQEIALVLISAVVFFKEIRREGMKWSRISVRQGLQL